MSSRIATSICIGGPIPRRLALQILEAFLRRHRIAFDRHSEANCKNDGNLIRYRPDMRKPSAWTANQGGRALVSRELIASAIKILERRKTQQALHLLRQIIGSDVAPLQPLSFTGRGRSSPATIETNVTNLLGL